MQLYALPQHTLVCGHRQLDLGSPQVMGILNVTPDSFSDGGRYTSIDAALAQATQMTREGAVILDIGGESTRPDADPVSEQQELDRVLPVVEALAQRLDVMLSIDTSSPSVFRAAAAMTPCIWNDVRALTRPNALQTAAELQLPVILMHMRGEPATMNQLAHYEDVLTEVMAELALRRDAALAAGIAAHNIILDMGFGFAKHASQNLQLLRELAPLHQLGHPLLMGISRKRVLGEVLGGVPPLERVYAGTAAALLGVQQGCSIVRTHDVLATVQTLKLWHAMQQV